MVLKTDHTNQDRGMDYTSGTCWLGQWEPHGFGFLTRKTVSDNNIHITEPDYVNVIISILSIVENQCSCLLASILYSFFDIQSTSGERNVSIFLFYKKEN